MKKKTFEHPTLCSLKKVFDSHQMLLTLYQHYSNFDIYIYKLVEGDPKAPFSIATTPRCRGGRYSIPRIAPLYPWTVPYNAEC